MPKVGDRVKRSTSSTLGIVASCQFNTANMRTAYKVHWDGAKAVSPFTYYDYDLTLMSQTQPISSPVPWTQGVGIVSVQTMPIESIADMLAARDRARDSLEPKCECGAHSCGSNSHAVWCDLFK